MKKVKKFNSVWEYLIYEILCHNSISNVIHTDNW